MVQVKQTKKSIAALAIAVCVVLTAAAFLLANMAGTGSKDGEMKIRTSFCDLYYPSCWEDTVVIVKEASAVRFLAGLESGEEVPLFDVQFQSEDGTFCHMIRGKFGRKISVALTVHPITPDNSRDQSQTDLLYAMQEDLNYLCARLPVVESAQETVQAAQPQEPEQEQKPQEEPVYEDMEIVTPYGRLSYPGAFEQYLRMNVVEGDTYVIEFHAAVAEHPQQHLFDVRIGTDVDSSYRFCTAQDGTVYWLALDRYAPDMDDTWTGEEMDIVYAMMDSAGELLQDLVPVEQDEASAEPESIRTPYGQLEYPGEMKESMRWEVLSSDPYTLAFYGRVGSHPEQHLYDICIGSGLEDPYGTVLAPNGKKVEIEIRYHSFAPDDSWTDAQINTVYGMLETANQILDQFTPVEASSGEQTQESEAGDILIRTPYGELRYPGKWKNNIRIQRSSGNPYQVHFYARSGSIAEQHLFSLVFGGEEGTEVASVTDAAGNTVSVKLVFAGIKGEEGADKDRLYAMLEDTSCLIDSLKAMSS